MDNPVTKIIDEVAEDICGIFCRYRDTCDDNCECENNGQCTLNECMYGDFLVYDDSQFDSGRYCLCDDVKKANKQADDRV